MNIIEEKVNLINNGKLVIQDDCIEEHFTHKVLNHTATLDAEATYKEVAFVVVTAPTNYDPKKNFFDTSAVENVIELVIKNNPDTVMVINFVVPVGIQLPAAINTTVIKLFSVRSF